MRAKYRQRVKQGLHHPTDGVPQQRRALWVFARIQVVTLLVGQADVQMPPPPGLSAEGLRHEARLQPMLVGHAFDQAFVTYTFINGLECVETMLQRQLELARSVLGDRRAYRQPLQRASCVEVIKKRLKLFQFVYAIHLWRMRA